MLIFGLCFALYFLKLSAGIGFRCRVSAQFLVSAISSRVDITEHGNVLYFLNSERWYMSVYFVYICRNVEKRTGNKNWCTKGTSSVISMAKRYFRH